MFVKFLISTVIFYSLLFLAGCSKDESPISPISTYRGVFVLYEGTSSPGSGDYAFIDFDDNSVSYDLFQNSNSNATLGLYPDGMMLYGTDLYVTSQGNYGHQGRMLRINASDNKLKDTLSFGANPYDFALALGYLFVTNLAASNVTKIDIRTMNLQNNIEVGLNPASIIHAVSNLYVTKTSYTSENSVAIINPFNDHVTKVYLPAPPVSAAFMFDGVYVSSYTRKKLYLIDTTLAPTQTKDSFAIQTVYPALTDVVAGQYPYLYIVNSQVGSFGSTGKLVYRFNVLTREASLLINDPTIVNIYGIAYDDFDSKIYIADAMSGAEGGVVRVYRADGSHIRDFDIYGLYPRKFAFRH
jgi:hypothetical protein